MITIKIDEGWVEIEWQSVAQRRRLLDFFVEHKLGKSGGRSKHMLHWMGPMLEADAQKLKAWIEEDNATHQLQKFGARTR